MTTSGAHTYQIPLCRLCGRPKYQKHAETCSGRLQRIAPPPEPEETCGCPPGMFHAPLCPLVTGKTRA